MHTIWKAADRQTGVVTCWYL